MNTETVMENIEAIVNEHSEDLTRRLIIAMNVSGFDDNSSMTLDIEEE